MLNIISIEKNKIKKVNAFAYIIRIANKSNDTSVCGVSDNSETACGFVLEFADIITTHQMNDKENTNKGRWPATPMRTYINDTIYNALPSDFFFKCNNRYHSSIRTWIK